MRKGMEMEEEEEEGREMRKGREKEEVKEGKEVKEVRVASTAQRGRCAAVPVGTVHAQWVGRGCSTPIPTPAGLDTFAPPRTPGRATVRT